MEENKFTEFPSFSMESDVRILTSGGLCIPAHSSVLGSVSPILEKMVIGSDGSPTTVRIQGVPCGAVVAFVQYLYSSRCKNEDMEKYGVHLLALSHVYSVPRLKRACGAALAAQLSVENVVDLLQLARLCDAPYLRVKCMNLLAKDFKVVEKTEGWRFLQDHDPLLELELLQFLDEAESRRKRRMRNRKDQSVYLQLNEAMECLQHICTEGCTNVRPLDMEPNKNKGPCSKFSTCRGLQLLIHHFATCKKRVQGRCANCKRMWQLIRLHSSLCDQPETCKVPLCRQFKEKTSGEDSRWELLVRKVVCAKAISSLSKRKREDEIDRQCSRG